MLSSSFKSKEHWNDEDLKVVFFPDKDFIMFWKCWWLIARLLGDWFSQKCFLEFHPSSRCQCRCTKVLENVCKLTKCKYRMLSSSMTETRCKCCQAQGPGPSVNIGSVSGKLWTGWGTPGTRTPAPPASSPPPTSGWSTGTSPSSPRSPPPPSPGPRAPSICVTSATPSTSRGKQGSKLVKIRKQRRAWATLEWE